MILNLITGRPHVATVKVTTTAGATVTCVLSPYSLSATANSSGVATFVVPKIGTWVCTATKNSITKSANASVTTVGSTVNLTITLGWYIFKAGEGAKVSFTKNEGDYGEITIATDSITFNPRYNSVYQSLHTTSNTAVDFTNYTKMCIETEYTKTSSWYQGDIQWFDNFEVNWYRIGDMDKHDRTLYSFDISSVTGKHGVVITDYSIPMVVYNVYLE